jgi:DNA-directed RNA polymerase
MNRYDVKKWDNWGQKNRVKLGTWLLDCVMYSSGWFEKVKSYDNNKTPHVVVPTPEFLQIKEEVMANAELFSPEAWPMLVEPNDWSPQHPGGYILNEVMKGHDMVRRSDDHLIQGEQIYTFLNKIQKVGYSVNRHVAAVAETLYERGITVGKFIPVWKETEPPKPPDIDTNDDSRQDYRRRKAEWHNKMNDNAQKSVRTRKIMEAVSRFKDRKQFFLPWSLDYRGRAYCIPAYLTPHDTDFGKSLLLFAEPAFMTEEAEGWLAFQVATTAGLDKKSMQERQDWVLDNYPLISRVATDPIGNIGDWENVDEPWQYMAACKEYYDCVIEQNRNWTSLPIAVDASCSGLQILCGLAKDKSTAKMVNVLPSDTPQDAYRSVAELAKTLTVSIKNKNTGEVVDHVIPSHLESYVDRSVAKRLVMTVPYNAKFKSNWGYVKDALEDKGLEPSKEEVTSVTHCLRRAMEELFPGPLAVMKWIETEVGKAIKRGATELQWVTPSGFVVTQRFMKVRTEQVNLQLMGRVRVNVAVDETDKVDINHHKNATSPNLIHSLDASILHFTVVRFDAPITLIHDSVLCRATDMGSLSTVVREVYMKLFADNDYLGSWAAQIGAEEQPPMIGDLEPSDVIESTYFFS